MRSDLAMAALASAAVPGMKPVAVAALVQDEETDHQQAVVEDATGRRWLIRSPLTPVAGARLRRGDELVRQLSRHVPFKVPAPVGYAAVGQDGHAVVYPHVEGMPLDFTHLPAGTGLASAVGRAVAAIHNIPRSAFEEQDLPVFDNVGCRQRLIAEVDRAAETGRVPTGLLARWEEAFDAAPLWQFATTPVHGAFRGSTVLVAFADEDVATGRVVAVTDWEEAMVADPATDLADLYATTSPAAWESVLDAYALARAQRPDGYLHARARLIAETRRLRGLAHAVAEQDEEATRRIVEALRRMDRLTEDDDSLVPLTARGAGTVSAATTASATAAAEEAPAPVVENAVAEQETADGRVHQEETADARAHEPSEPRVERPVELDDDATAEVPVEAALAGFARPEDEHVGGDASTEDGPTEEDELADEEPDHSRPVGVAETSEPAVEGQDVTEVGEPSVEGQDEAEVGEPSIEGQDDSEVGEPSVEGQDNTEVGEASGQRQDDAEGDVIADDELASDPAERLHELYGMPSPDRDES